MARRPLWLGWLGLAAGLGFISAAAAPALRAGLFRHRTSALEVAAAQVPLQELPPEVREQVRHVLDKPTLFTQGPAESFTCHPPLYQWLLDHPDQAVLIWRRLGARCMEVQNHGAGLFGWTDGQGTDVRWRTVYRSPALRIWFAEGQARAAGILPLIPVKAVVVLHHDVSRSDVGRTLIQHQADMFMYTDSKTAALIARLLGPTSRPAGRAVRRADGNVLFGPGLVSRSAPGSGRVGLGRHPARGRAPVAGAAARARTPLPAGSVPPATMSRYGG